MRTQIKSNALYMFPETSVVDTWDNFLIDAQVEYQEKPELSATVEEQMAKLIQVKLNLDYEWVKIN